jgi:hypothetical protein
VHAGNSFLRCLIVLFSIDPTSDQHTYGVDSNLKNTHFPAYTKKGPAGLIDDKSDQLCTNFRLKSSPFPRLLSQWSIAPAFPIPVASDHAEC